MKRLRDRIRTIYYVAKYQHVLRKATFGPKTTISCKLDITGSGKVRIGSNCTFERNPWGEGYVTIYTHRPDAKIVIGNNVIMRATKFGSHLSIIIEDSAVLENASIYDSDFHNIDATIRDEDFNKRDRRVVIGHGSYVGCECLCSKGTVLKEKVIMLSAGVAGTRTLPDNSFVGGNPVRAIK